MINKNKQEKILQTQHFYLRIFDKNDLENLYSLVSDPDVGKWLGCIQTKEQAKETLSRFIEHQDKYGFSYWAVFEKGTNDFVGWAGLRYLSKPPHEVEIGYSLHKKYWGKGYATELAKVIIEWGFVNFNMDKIVSFTLPDNIASRRVMEKAGMKYVKNYEHKGFNCIYYEIKKDEKVN